MSTIYLAGPMTGFEHYNHAAFMAAKERLQEAGHIVATPFEANSSVWWQAFGRPFDPKTDRCDYGDPLLRQMFAADVELLLSCDRIALLDGWRKSKGATLEYQIATALGLEAIDEWGEPITETVLQEAQRLVHGDRGASYGHPIEDYEATGRIWAATLDRWLRQQPGFEDAPPLPDIDPRIAALMMVGVKVSREAHRPKRDNRTDMAGYAECVDMIAQRQDATLNNDAA